MDTTAIVAIVVLAAVIVLGVVAWQVSSQKKSGQLKDRFGSEYDETVQSADSRRAAERELKEREERVQKLHLKEIPVDQRDGYVEEWKTTQSRFVDDPNKAIDEADTLVQKVMDARGYPITNFDQQAADISVDHPDVVRNYREAHAIAVSNTSDGATTEDLRRAMVHYRELFSELLGAKAA
jgi:DNA helicase HerA-like ATPase